MTHHNHKLNFKSQSILKSKSYINAESKIKINQRIAFSKKFIPSSTEQNHNMCSKTNIENEEHNIRIEHQKHNINVLMKTQYGFVIENTI